MNTKQTPGNNILSKLNTNTMLDSLWSTIAKLSKKELPAQQNRSIHFKIEKDITDIDKAKASNEQFMNVTLYSTDQINRHIDHSIKTLPTGKI